MTATKAKKVVRRLLPDEIEAEYPPPRLRAKWKILREEMTPAQRAMEKLK